MKLEPEDQEAAGWGDEEELILDEGKPASSHDTNLVSFDWPIRLLSSHTNHLYSNTPVK